VLSLSPADVMPGVEIYGQHEISELTKSPEKLTLLLSRFRERQEDLGERKSTVRLDLERSRNRLNELRREIRAVDERLAALPGLEETLKRYQDAGLEDKLKQKSLLVREEQVFRSLDGRLGPVREWRNSLAELIPLEVAFLSPKALQGLPHADLLAEAGPLLSAFSQGLQGLGEAADNLIAELNRKLAELRARWGADRVGIEAEYEKMLRELQKSKVDGEEFIRLRRQIEELRPLGEGRDALVRDLNAQETRRRSLVAEWEASRPRTTGRTRRRPNASPANCATA
jgi:DNA repair exonuclease SbcCD ATPase subunit